jgi:hypothetical protein
VPDPSDIQVENAARSASAAKRADLQSKIRSGLAALQSGPRRLVVRAQNVDQPLMHALGERAKAAHNLQLLGLVVPASAPIAGTDEAGHAFQFEAGRVFRSEAGHPWRQSHGSI